MAERWGFEPSVSATQYENIPGPPYGFGLFRVRHLSEREVVHRSTGVAAAGDSAGEIKRVKFSSGVAKQISKAGETLGLLQADCRSAYTKGPVLAVFVEHPRLRT